MNKPSDLIIRRAEERDIPFLIEAIVEAEKSGTELFSYSSIFELPEKDVRNLFAKILTEDVQGQELCYSDYLVAEVNGQPAGVVAAWVEHESGQSSSILKGTLLNYFFPGENVEKAIAKKNLLDDLRFEPEVGALIIDICYTAANYRGQGIVSRLINTQFRLHLKRNPSLKLSQIDVLNTNVAAFKVYEKLGYVVKEEKRSNDPLILKLLPSNALLIMEKHF